VPQPPQAQAEGRRYPSAEIIAELARERRLAQLSEIDALDGKAANLIGFAAVVLGLLFTSGIAKDVWDTPLTVGAALLALSLVPLGFAVFPRTYRFNPNIGAFKRLAMNWDPAATHAATADSIGRAIRHNQDLMRRKARAVQAGTIVLVVAVLLVGGRLIYALQQEQTDGIASATSRQYHR
jgi:hypothetical protein